MAGTTADAGIEIASCDPFKKLINYPPSRRATTWAADTNNIPGCYIAGHADAVHYQPNLIARWQPIASQDSKGGGI
jgi:hypothetical protein